MRGDLHADRTYRADECALLITGGERDGEGTRPRAIHGLSAQARRLFAAENCAGHPGGARRKRTLLGFARGAFTGAQRGHKGRLEAARGGTLFLDEVGDLPLEIQAKVLRALSERAVRPLGAPSRSRRFRLIAATARNLRDDVARGVFRADLFYRILGVEIRIPPLRERREDILPIAEHFFARHGEARAPAPRLTKQAQRVLTDYAWPGNVRELETKSGGSSSSARI